MENIFVEYKEFFERKLESINTKEDFDLRHIDNELLTYIFYIKDLEKIDMLADALQDNGMDIDAMTLFALDALHNAKENQVEYDFEAIKHAIEKGASFDVIKRTCQNKQEDMASFFDKQKNAFYILLEYTISTAKEQGNSQDVTAISEKFNELFGAKLHPEQLKIKLSELNKNSANMSI